MRPDRPSAPSSAPRGRGAGGNPPNRFEPLSVELEEPGPDKAPTLYLRDATRSIIATNDSPDVGFDASINPYRGCEHGCSYCLDGDTPILMGDGTHRPLRDVRVGDVIYGTRRHGWYRRYQKTRVLAHWETAKPAHELTLADGTRLVASADHRFLTDRGWKHVTGAEQGSARRPHVTLRSKLMGTGRFAVPPDTDELDYRRGYLCGLIRGDGHVGSYEYERAGRAHGDQHHFRLALADRQALDRARDYLIAFGIDVHEFAFQEAVGGRRQLDAIRVSAKAAVDRIRELIGWPLAASIAWHRGFLAGIFDAEGSYSCGVLRISNTDAEIIERILQCLRVLGLRFAVEDHPRPTARSLRVVRLTGGLAACMRFWHSIGNAISRKRDIEGHAVKSAVPLEVVSVEPFGEALQLFDITTGTGDFIADGVVSHNCYARPTHEYFGLSAGLDFETRIFVKEEAPALLRRELSSRRWRPRVL
ncbi:MAG TPA: LAGLIDADG family homing endonuclease, partial [Thermoanaerobaculia bacterium]|nr:LAGLIDADG family homing endonuclease [Thermoanaerobaculia bacterium]